MARPLRRGRAPDGWDGAAGKIGAMASECVVGSGKTVDRAGKTVDRAGKTRDRAGKTPRPSGRRHLRRDVRPDRRGLAPNGRDDATYVGTFAPTVADDATYVGTFAPTVASEARGTQRERRARWTDASTYVGTEREARPSRACSRRNGRRHLRPDDRPDRAGKTRDRAGKTRDLDVDTRDRAGKTRDRAGSLPTERRGTERHLRRDRAGKTRPSREARSRRNGRRHTSGPSGRPSGPRPRR